MQEHAEANSQKLQLTIEEYFSRQGSVEKSASEEQKRWGFRDEDIIRKQKEMKSSVELSIKQFVRENHDVVEAGFESTNQGRTIAKIFHGTNSPKFPAYEWYRNEVWGKYGYYNFLGLARMASAELQRYKSKNT